MNKKFTLTTQKLNKITENTKKKKLIIEIDVLLTRFIYETCYNNIIFTI